MLSSNIAFNAMVSQHVSNNAIVAAKISDSNIEHRHLEFRTKASDTAGTTALNPARVVQLGQAADNVKYARVSATFTAQASDARNTARILFTAAVASDAHCLDYGVASPFTATPMFANMPNVEGTGPGNSYLVLNVMVSALNSVSADLVYNMSAVSGGGAVITNTVHAEIYGK